MKEEIGVKIGVDANPDTINLIQHIEKEIDAVMNPNGFTRKGTIKRQGYTVFNYRQFAVCGNHE